MRRHRQLHIIAKQREFDAARWQQLLTAFAYVLHDQRQRREAALSATQPPTKDQP